MADDIVEQRLTQIAPTVLPLASVECSQVCTALAAAQGEFEAPQRTKEAKIGNQFSYKYAPLEEIIRVIKGPMAKNGLGRQQYLVSRGGSWFIRTIIWHSSGEWIGADYPIHPAKDGAQGFAIGVTYARRYGLSLVLGLSPEDDTDGVEDSGGSNPTPRRPPPGPRAAPVAAPPPPRATQPPHDPATGEILPHRIEPQPTPAGDGTDWVKWGGAYIAALKQSATLAEAEQWVAANAPALATCHAKAPRAATSVEKAIFATRDRLKEKLEPDFIPADDDWAPLN